MDTLWCCSEGLASNDDICNSGAGDSGAGEPGDGEANGRDGVATGVSAAKATGTAAMAIAAVVMVTTVAVMATAAAAMATMTVAAIWMEKLAKVLVESRLGLILIVFVVPEELKLAATFPCFLSGRWHCRGGGPGRGWWRRGAVLARRQRSYDRLGLDTY